MKKLRRKILILVACLLLVPACGNKGGASSTSVASSSSVSSYLRLSASSLSLEVGESQRLVARSDRSGEVLWSSSNPNVATVDDGLVVGLESGETDITATLGELNASCHLLVTGEKSLSIKMSSKKLYVGTTLQLTPETFYGKKTLKGEYAYTSMDESVASVDENGLVTGIKRGSVEIRIEDKSEAALSSSISLEVLSRINLVPSKTSVELYANQSSQSSAKIPVSVSKNGRRVANAAFAVRSLDEEVAIASHDGQEVTIQARKSGSTGVVISFEGTEVAIAVNSAYLVKTKKDLIAVGNDYHGRFVLANDIDLGGTDWTPLSPWPGDAYTPDVSWQGVLDGRGHTISNVRFPTGWHRAIIAQTGPNAIIENLSLVGIENASGSNEIGSIVALNYGTIRNCYVENSICGDSRGEWLPHGGFVAINGQDGRIENCIAKLKISRPVANTGAFCGYNWAKIENCFAVVEGGALPFIYKMTSDYGSTSHVKAVRKEEESLLYDASIYRDFDEDLWEITGEDVPTLRNFPQVRFEKEDLYLSIGHSYQIDPCTIRGVSQSWSFGEGFSDSFSCFELDSGIEITPLKEGSATMSVSLANGSKASVRVHAKQKVITPSVEKVALDFQNPRLVDSLTLQVFDEEGGIVSADSLSFASSDPAVMAVSPKGTITAKGEGSAYVIVVLGEDKYTEFALVTVTGWTQISTLEGLDAIRDGLQGSYVLVSDIDGKGANFSTITRWDGKGEEYHFGGRLDGNGHIVKNLCIEGGRDTNGIFGQTAATSIIENIAFENITGPAETTNDSGIVGFNEGIIRNVEVELSATHGGKSSVHGAGTIAGTNEFSGQIEDCYSILKVDSLPDGDATEYLGGLIGLSQGSMDHCFSIVYGKAYARITQVNTFSNSIPTHCFLYRAASLEEAKKNAISELAPFSFMDAAIWNKKEGELPTLKRF